MQNQTKDLKECYKLAKKLKVDFKYNTRNSKKLSLDQKIKLSKRYL